MNLNIFLIAADNDSTHLINKSAFLAIAQVADGAKSQKLKNYLLDKNKPLSAILSEIERMIGGNLENSAFFLSEREHANIAGILSKRRQNLPK